MKKSFRHCGKMCKVRMLRALVKQRLTAAALEIFGLFERTIAEYEEELCRSKEENERQQKLLDAVFNPQLRLHRADAQQLLVVKEEAPFEQQRWSYSLDQEDPEPPHIKKEQEELWTSQEGEQLQWLEEADIKFPFTLVTVKSEDNEEKPQSSQLHQRQSEPMETEADGEDCGGPEPARKSDPDTHPEPYTVDKTGDSSEPETDDSVDWKETRGHQSGLKVHVRDSRRRTVDSNRLRRHSRLHKDINIREVTPENHSALIEMCQGRADRYGCLLFRFVTPEEQYRAWCITTNWDGSRGKWELPRNLKKFLISSQHRMFPTVTVRDEKKLINRVNELLRTPRQFAMGLLYQGNISQTHTHT